MCAAREYHVSLSPPYGPELTDRTFILDSWHLNSIEKYCSASCPPPTWLLFLPWAPYFLLCQAFVFLLSLQLMYLILNPEFHLVHHGHNKYETSDLRRENEFNENFHSYLFSCYDIIPFMLKFPPLFDMWFQAKTPIQPINSHELHQTRKERKSTFKWWNHA